MADILRKHFPDHAVIGRLGGDKFAVCQNDCGGRAETEARLTRMYEDYRAGARAILKGRIYGYSVGAVEKCGRIPPTASSMSRRMRRSTPQKAGEEPVFFFTPDRRGGPQQRGGGGIMKLLFKQQVFSWFDSYDIYGEDGETVFTVRAGSPGGTVWRFWPQGRKCGHGERGAPHPPAPLCPLRGRSLHRSD